MAVEVAVGEAELIAERCELHPVRPAWESENRQPMTLVHRLVELGGGHRRAGTGHPWSEIAVEQSQVLMTKIQELRLAWTDRLSAHRVASGVRPTPRADSAVARRLAQLPESPVMTATTLAKIFNVSFPAASAALEELRQAEILTTKSIQRGAKAYIAGEVLDLITLSERALASTQFDTSTSPPNRGVPARP